jgi:phosphoribosylformimino-5-aminoimidazole carboxamide ribotide isomerase
MLVIPAIDLKDGQCVRLRQGRMEDSTVFSDNPVQMAGQWMKQGARRLHIVDLNGAFAGTPVNGEFVTAIAKAYPQLPIQIGGGIRDLESIRFYVEAGVSFVIIGTAAVKDPQFVIDACAEFPGKVIVGLDAVNGKVATEGWADVSETTAIDLAQKFSDCGVQAIVYTDISRDGMMQGVNVESTVELAENSTIPVIASGGVSKLADIVDLKAVADTKTGAGIMGAITGRAIYDGELDLAEAQAYCDSVLQSRRKNQKA